MRSIEIASVEDPSSGRKRWIHSALLAELLVILIAIAIYVPGLVSPPHLMDDVDAAEAIQAKNILVTGDWVTQHLNGTPYFDKAPLKYWVTAALYSVFGIHDWVARLPTVIAAVLLCWLVARIGRWADSPQVGFYSGLVMATSIGLFLFTRTIIPDVILTLFITLTLWCFIRSLDDEKPSLGCTLSMYAAMACAVLTKGLIGVMFPVGIGTIYLLATKQLMRREIWRRLKPGWGILLFLMIAVPWHVFATVRNPPVFDFSLHVGPDFGGKFRGFFWFYFVNEQLLRFLNERWPKDYNTVPRIWFWIYHLLWFFPWSLFLPAVARLNFKPVDRASCMRLLAVFWIAVVMLFFTFSTTQEYYSMPIYPAVALLLGWAMASGSKWLKFGLKAAGVISISGAAVIATILIEVRKLPTPGDIFSALVQHPDMYTLSMGHMADLTLPAFAYLQLPLELAGIALLVGGLAVLLSRRERAYVATAVMLVVFFQAAQLALVVFDPYLSSYAVAQKLNQLPRGTVIVCGKYNPLSSVFFYSRDGALQNDRDLDILEYGSMAPGAPKISISDDEMRGAWNARGRVYVIAKNTKLQHVEEVLGRSNSHLIFRSGDKYLFTNHLDAFKGKR